MIAASGTALAAGHYLITSSKQIKPGAIALGNLSRSARNALHGSTGPRGRAGTPGNQGAPGLQGGPGAPGAPGTARAYGWVGAGTLDPTLGSKDVASVSGTGGVNCITLSDGLTSRTSGIVAIPDFNADDTNAGDDQAQTVVEVAHAPSCPGGFTVVTFKRTYTLSGGVVTHTTLTRTNEGFFFMVP